MSNSYNQGSEGRLDNLPVPNQVPLSPIFIQSGRELPSCDIRTSSPSASDEAHSTGNQYVSNSNYHEGVTMPPSSGPVESLLPNLVNLPISNSQNNSTRPSNSASSVTAVRCNQFYCEYCNRTFNSFRGLGVHKSSAHAQEANSNIDISRRKPRWQPEDLNRLAEAEVNAPNTMRTKINEYLLETVKLNPPRTQESIKALRKTEKYKISVRQCKERMREQNDSTRQTQGIINQYNNLHSSDNLHSNNNINTIADNTNNSNTYRAIAVSDNSLSWINEALSFLRSSACEDPARFVLGYAVEDVRQGRDPCNHLSLWFKKNFGVPKKNEKKIINNYQQNTSDMSNKQKRRHDYSRIQQTWKTNPSKVATIILDDGISNTQHLPLATQVEYWKPIIEEQSCNFDERLIEVEELDSEMMSPITIEEVIRFRPPIQSAHGVDGLSPTDWCYKVNNNIKAIIMNILLSSGKVPKLWTRARTVLIPKNEEWQNPSNYRPISISSIIIRHFHKILANRISLAIKYDERQRGFIRADGAAEIIYSLASVIDIARHDNKQLHMAFLDIKKAFDSVSHHSIIWSLRNKGLPLKLIEYIKYIYDNSEMCIEIDGEQSETIKPGRGVRQGDPLSSIIFNIVMDEILNKLPPYIGFEYRQIILNALAFADDLVLFASTTQGLQTIIDLISEEASKHGLLLSPSKCKCVSYMPSGKEKKIKIIEEPQFHNNNEYLPQIGVTDTWTHLGVTFTSRGITPYRFPLEEYLLKITKAPLKPQQRLLLLKTYLLPRLLYSLVLGKVNYGYLQKSDRLIRKFVRKWLHLPNDVPIAYFHTKIKDGGLGIMSLYTKIPALKVKRITNLRNSSLRFVRDISKTSYCSGQLRWARLHNSEDDKWSEILYRHVDGWELRESSKVVPSSSWVMDPRLAIPAADWIKYHKVRINALPTRMRTTRGHRRIHQDVQCRAGCNVPETTAHVIQECHRTHGGRIMRHNAVSKSITKAFNNHGYTIVEEPIIQTSEGNRKPDILIVKESNAFIIDTQIVSGYRDLNEAHERKKNYYESNRDVINYVANNFNIPTSNIIVSTITISWRGIWSEKSYEALRVLGVTKNCMQGITTRVLFGSYMNFVKFNKMTTVQMHHIWPFRRRRVPTES